MNTLVLLMAASCSPAADPMPVTQTTPYVPRSVAAATQDWPEAHQQSHPRLFARLRGIFSRKSHAPEGQIGQTLEPPTYSQGIPVNGTLSPAPIASPGMSMGNASTPIFHPQPAFTPASSPTQQRMPTGQPF